MATPSRPGRCACTGTPFPDASDGPSWRGRHLRCADAPPSSRGRTGRRASCTRYPRSKIVLVHPGSSAPAARAANAAAVRAAPDEAGLDHVDVHGRSNTSAVVALAVEDRNAVLRALERACLDRPGYVCGVDAPPRRHTTRPGCHRGTWRRLARADASRTPPRRPPGSPAWRPRTASARSCSGRTPGGIRASGTAPVAAGSRAGSAAAVWLEDTGRVRAARPPRSGSRVRDGSRSRGVRTGAGPVVDRPGPPGGAPGVQWDRAWAEFHTRRGHRRT